MVHVRLGLLGILACAVLYGCTPKQDSGTAPLDGDAKRSKRLPKPVAKGEPEVMEDPVAFWGEGQSQGQVDAAAAHFASDSVVVAGVVEAPGGAHFTQCPPDYERDEAFQKEYAATAKDEDAWKAFKAKYLDVSEAEYQKAVAK